MVSFIQSAGISNNNALSGGVFFPNRLPAGLHILRYVRLDSECGADTATASIYVETAGDPNSNFCGDLDGDGIINKLDDDVDGDGISNIVEGTVNGVAYNPFGNHDQDELFNFQDSDFAQLIGSAFVMAL